MAPLPALEPVTGVPERVEVSRWRAHVKVSSSVVWFVAGVAAVTLAACWYWRIWDGGLRGPLAYGGDSLLFQSFARTVAKRHWYLTNPLLGAPGGQALYDYPWGGDNLNFVLLRVFGVFSANPILLINVFYYLSFPLVFASAYYSFTRLRLSPSVSATVAVVFTLAPYHFTRVAQPFLAAYYSVPLACLLLYDILSEPEREPGVPTPTSRWVRLRQRFRPRWVWIPVVVAMTGGYYSLFFVILASALGILLVLHYRSIYQLLLPGFLVILTLLILCVNNLPTFVYQFSHGTNPVVAQRELGSADNLALQWGYLLLPVQDHRFAPLAEIRESAESTRSSFASLGSVAIGFLAAVGLVISLGALVSRKKSPTARDELARRSGVLNVAAILLGSVGGGSLLLGLVGFHQLREYDRLMVFVGFFSLAALAGAMEWLRGRLKSRMPGLPRAAGLGALAVVTILALLDQTVGAAPHRTFNVTNAESDRVLAREIEARFGAEAMVLEVPLLGFPEDAIAFPGKSPSPGSTVDGQAVFGGFELLRPTLYTDHVRWSYGRIQARPGDVAASLRQKPMDTFLTEAVAAGFSALYVDRNGFPDRAAGLGAELDRRLGGPALASSTDRMVVYDLRDYARRWHAATPRGEVDAETMRVRHPVDVDWGAGISSADGIGQYFPQLAGYTSGRFARESSSIALSNPSGEPRQVTIHVTVRVLSAPTGRFSLRGGATEFSADVTNMGTPVAVTTTLPPGRTTFRLSADTPEVDLPAPVGSASIHLEDPWLEG